MAEGGVALHQNNFMNHHQNFYYSQTSSSRQTSKQYSQRENSSESYELNTTPSSRSRNNSHGTDVLSSSEVIPRNRQKNGQNSNQLGAINTINQFHAAGNEYSRAQRRGEKLDMNNNTAGKIQFFTPQVSRKDEHGERRHRPHSRSGYLSDGNRNNSRKKHQNIQNNNKVNEFPQSCFQRFLSFFMSHCDSMILQP